MIPGLPPPPVVMCFSGLDPTGGAGIQADIEAIASMGCHTAPLVTAITAQDSLGIKSCTSVDTRLFKEQARLVLEDLPVTACKIGLVTEVAMVQAIQAILIEHPELPVVLDPVLASGRGDQLVEGPVQEAIRSLLLPLTTIVTPNSVEARALAPQAAGMDEAAEILLEHGARFVLVTGSHEDTELVTNILYRHGRRPESFEWERLPYSFHGSGCTLASAIAALLATGLEPATAVYEAQEYAWQALVHGYRLGSGQLFPNRLFWVQGTEQLE